MGHRRGFADRGNGEWNMPVPSQVIENGFDLVEAKRLMVFQQYSDLQYKVD